MEWVTLVEFFENAWVGENLGFEPVDKKKQKIGGKEKSTFLVEAGKISKRVLRPEKGEEEEAN